MGLDIRSLYAKALSVPKSQRKPDRTREEQLMFKVADRSLSEDERSSAKWALILSNLDWIYLFSLKVCRYWESLGGEYHDAEDLAQHVCGVLFNKLDNLNPQDYPGKEGGTIRLATYLRKVCYTVCIRWLRNQRGGEDLALNEQHEHIAEEPFFQFAVVLAESVERILQSRGYSIKDRDPQVLLMHLVYGMTFREIGETFNITASGAFLIYKQMIMLLKLELDTDWLFALEAEA